MSDLLLRGIKDSRVKSGMVSVTDVEVSGDLRHARIFVSIYGSDEDQGQAMAGLQSASGYIRSEIGKRVNLRFAPEVTIHQDKSLERGAEMLALIDRIAREDKARAAEG
jgi:ribosome-binding factor A